MNSYEQEIKNDWQKFSAQHSDLKPNIMLLGATGCGKSSLINCIFDKDLATVNDTTRGTTGFHVYKGDEHGLGVNLFDSQGYELGDSSNQSFEQYSQNIENALQSNNQEDYLNKIHIVWYCISVKSKRIQPMDIKTLKTLMNDSSLRQRVAVVFTKCDEDDEQGSIANKFKDIIANDVSRYLKTFETSTDKEFRLDIDKLMVWSADQLSDADYHDAEMSMREVFVSKQVQNLKLKKETAQKRIAAYAAGAGGTGFVPIPFADSAVLIPLQVTMAVHIIRIYGLDSFASISTAVLSDAVVSNLGKAAVI